MCLRGRFCRRYRRCGHDLVIHSRQGAAAILPQVPKVKAAARAPLLDVQPMRAANVRKHNHHLCMPLSYAFVEDVHINLYVFSYLLDIFLRHSERNAGIIIVVRINTLDLQCDRESTAMTSFVLLISLRAYYVFSILPAWIGNCVGHYNYKFFVCFLVWTVATCGFSMFLIIGRVTAMLDSSRPFRHVWSDGDNNSANYIRIC